MGEKSRFAEELADAIFTETINGYVDQVVFLGSSHISSPYVENFSSDSA